MTYYFHLVSESVRILDDVGIQAESEVEAYLGAIKALRDLYGEVDATDWRHWSLEVADPTGQVIFTIKLTSQCH
jgi:hypothetical protein